MAYDRQINAKKNKLITIFGLKDAELTWLTESENVQEFECNKCFVTKNKTHKCLLTVCRRSESHVEAWTECELYEKQTVSSTICTKLLRCLWEYTSEINPYAKVWKSWHLLTWKKNNKTRRFRKHLNYHSFCGYL